MDIKFAFSLLCLGGIKEGEYNSWFNIEDKGKVDLPFFFLFGLTVTQWPNSTINVELLKKINMN